MGGPSSFRVFAHLSFTYSWAAMGPISLATLVAWHSKSAGSILTHLFHVCVG
jgi:hypothetical protein